MLTLFNLIYKKSKSWIDDKKTNNLSVVGNFIRYIQTQNKLREPQIEAIEIYLWLKFVGQNKKISEIIKAGLLYSGKTENINANNSENESFFIQQFLQQFANENQIKNFENFTQNNLSKNNVDLNLILDELLHDFSYPNFLFSLPMGAGKTFLMACFIYIDFYFAIIDKSDKRFAHNFIVFAPHASKTAILPSLKTISKFDPKWILPQNEANYLKQLINIEVLDSLSSKRKDKLHGNNPNLEKVNRLLQTNTFGLVFITNAEKVVLEKSDSRDVVFANSDNLFDAQKRKDEFNKSNELRDKLSKIPSLAIILDEVHHVYKGEAKHEKKLRKAVNILNQQKNIVSVIGMSGTPYIKTKLQLGDKQIVLNQIQDIVYNYSLASGIGNFLKIPEIVKVEDVKENVFIKQSLTKFFNDFDIIYSNETKSKIVFYCANIKSLNEEILPVINQWYYENRQNMNHEIFKYYSSVNKQNKIYELPKENLVIFNNLDKSHSKIRVILLVAIGTEGWDCKSLTSVVLPRKTTTKNFVLQTTARCLREVVDAKNEKALIYLGAGNYETLNDELKENYRISINDLKIDSKRKEKKKIKSKIFSKPKKEICQSKVSEINANSIELIKIQLQNFNFNKFLHKHKYSSNEIVNTINKDELKSTIKIDISNKKIDDYYFYDFLYSVSKALFYRYSTSELLSNFEMELDIIYKTVKHNSSWIQNNPFINLDEVLVFIASHFAID